MGDAAPGSKASGPGQGTAKAQPCIALGVDSLTTLMFHHPVYQVRMQNCWLAPCKMYSHKVQAVMWQKGVTRRFPSDSLQPASCQGEAALTRQPCLHL